MRKAAKKRKAEESKQEADEKEKKNKRKKLTSRKLKIRTRNTRKTKVMKIGLRGGRLAVGTDVAVGVAVGGVGGEVKLQLPLLTPFPSHQSQM